MKGLTKLLKEVTKGGKK